MVNIVLVDGMKILSKLSGLWVFGSFGFCWLGQFLLGSSQYIECVFGCASKWGHGAYCGVVGGFHSHRLKTAFDCLV